MNVLKSAVAFEKSGPGVDRSVPRFEYCKSVRIMNLFLRASNVAMNPKLRFTLSSVRPDLTSTDRFLILPCRKYRRSINKELTETATCRDRPFVARNSRCLNWLFQ